MLSQHGLGLSVQVRVMHVFGSMSHENVPGAGGGGGCVCYTCKSNLSSNTESRKDGHDLTDKEPMASSSV